jgi:pimeloyl-ACP methyl ester carboxylesterase
MSSQVKTLKVGDVNVFYREAGNVSKPHVVLLHGFPSSSHQFRHLIPLLSKSYHVVAPDLPGFGFTEYPEGHKPTFAGIAKVIGDFLAALKITEFAVYVFDYGAPTAWRIALTRPDLKIKAIVSQNGNAYEEGFGAEFWAPIRAAWTKDNEKAKAVLREVALSLQFTTMQYQAGVPENKVHRIEPESYHLDYALFSLPGRKEAQVDLFVDYQTNVDIYPDIQKYFRGTQTPTLAIWGKGDPCFIAPGAEAFKKDNKNAVVKLLDTGHFALETDVDVIGSEILKFFNENGF